MEGKKCRARHSVPAPGRLGITLVDLTGAGVVVAAVPHSHLVSVLQTEAYPLLNYEQPGALCVTSHTVTALLLHNTANSFQQASFLVKNKDSWQLMSQKQWASYSLITPPLIADATSNKLGNRVMTSAKAGVRVAKKLYKAKDPVVASK